jgi:hypothetical protein
VNASQATITADTAQTAKIRPYRTPLPHRHLPQGAAGYSVSVTVPLSSRTGSDATSGLDSAPGTQQKRGAGFHRRP